LNNTIAAAATIVAAAMTAIVMAIAIAVMTANAATNTTAAAAVAKAQISNYRSPLKIHFQKFDCGKYWLYLPLLVSASTRSPSDFLHQSNFLRKPISHI